MGRDLTIVLLGKSGVGKSAAGNTILGRAAFESDPWFSSVTEEISVETGRVFEKQISVIDTPGILDNEETTENIETYCQNLLQSKKRCLFLVVLSIGRFTQEDQMAVDAAKRVLGDQGSRKSYLLFTNGDKLKNKSLTDFIFAEKDSKLADVVKMFSGAFHLFNNVDGDQEQVRDLLLKTGNLRDQLLLDLTAPRRRRRSSIDEPPSVAQPKPVQRRIVLLGLPGVGKSSSGNTILGSKKFRSACNFDPVSTKCVSESESVDGRLLQVVDTPGFTDEVLTLQQLYEEIMKTLVEASPGPHAFVIVVRLGRISEADKRLFELLPKLFGEDASKYTMVLFTHGDGLEDQSVDDLIQSNSSMSDLVSMCGGRYCVFNNTQRGNRLQVRELLSKIDEMVEANGGEHYTSDMFRMAETFIREEMNRAAQSADRNPSGTSADRNPSGTSADRNPSGRSDGANSAAVKQTVLERLKPYAIRTGRGWLIDAAANVAVGAAVGAVVGVGAGVFAGAGAVVGALVGVFVGAGAGAKVGAVAVADANAVAVAVVGAVAVAVAVVGAVAGAVVGAVVGAGAVAGAGVGAGVGAGAVVGYAVHRSKPMKQSHKSSSGDDRVRK